MAENATSSPGVQVRVWLQDGMYDALKSRATRRRTSVSEEARRAIQLGMHNADELDAIEGRLAEMETYLHEHLEALVFATAMDSAYATEAWRHQHRIIPAFRGQEADIDRQLRERATARVQRLLRLGLGNTDERDESEGDADGEE